MANEQANSKTVKFIFLYSRKHYSCAAWIAQFEEQMKGQRDFMHSSDVSVVVHGCPWPGILITLLFFATLFCGVQLHLLSRTLATDSLACSIHYFSFVSNAAVLWILALLCFIQDLVICVDFSRPCTVFLLFHLQTTTWVFCALAGEAVLQFDLHKIAASEIMVKMHL